MNREFRGRYNLCWVEIRRENVKSELIGRRHWVKSKGVCPKSPLVYSQAKDSICHYSLLVVDDLENRLVSQACGHALAPLEPQASTITKIIWTDNVAQLVCLLRRG
ncbi:hypothetical protein EVAR_28782_1 [Eumeta japonica]|uniref:Uncharacterized protein n=1 Tax=Eumeta variegata TaxID=151549 RepID=A0A4C1VFY7_EUMVA|nr:hypothetical protein EVAR_28782_1 [Eumeta japonica]